ncbi:MAG: flagellar biosynthesis protein FlhF [Pseudomonadales bacterium]
MKIKRFHATTMRAALQQVREEQGPDAVILSKRRVDDGIEVIAAVDYDEALLQQWARERTPGSDRFEVSPGASVPGAPATATAAARHIGMAAYGTAQTDDTGPGAPPAANDTPGRRPEPATASQAAPARSEDAASAAKPIGRTTTAGGTPDFRAIFDAASTIATLPEPGKAPAGATLAEIVGKLDALAATVSEQFESLHWDALQRREPRLAGVVRRLESLGLDRRLVRTLISALDPQDDAKKLWRNAIALLARRIPMLTQDVCEEGGVFAVVGPTGSGKTTSIAKLAARFALTHGAREVGLVTTDSYRIGAQEHLQRFGRILGVPVQVAASGDILRATLDQLADRRLVLVDTAGFSPRDGEMLARLAALTERTAVQTLITLPANLQTAGLTENLKAFGRLGIDGVIVTKVDEATSLGGLLSALIEAEAAVCYVADGQRVPEDIRPASRYRAEFVSQAVALAHRFADAEADDTFVDIGAEQDLTEPSRTSTITEHRLASNG